MFRLNSEVIASEFVDCANYNARHYVIFLHPPLTLSFLGPNTVLRILLPNMFYNFKTRFSCLHSISARNVVLLFNAFVFHFARLFIIIHKDLIRHTITVCRVIFKGL